MNTLYRTFLRPGKGRWLAAPAQVRHASILGSLSDVREAYNKRIRRGRGPASGKGKTSGRGHKGQKQHGKVPAGFNGGQTPDEVVRGKRGFTRSFTPELSVLNLGRLQQWIDAGRIDPAQPITLRELLASRAVHGIKDGVKLLGDGAAAFQAPIEITVSRASKTAIAAIEKAGGRVTTRFFNRAGIRAITHPHRFEEPPRLAGPSSRTDYEYYRDPAHRGYLSADVAAQGKSPSLFFKPFDAKSAHTRKDKAKAQKQANRLF